MKKKFLFAALLICGSLPSVAEEKPRYQDASFARGRTGGRFAEAHDFA